MVGSVAVAIDGANAIEAGKQLAALQAQACILFLTGPPAAAFVKAVWAAGSSPSFYCASIVSGEVMAMLLGAEARNLAIMQVVPYPWDGANPDAMQFRALAEKAALPVTYFSYDGYLMGRVTVAALAQAGRDVSRARLHAVMRTFKMRVAGVDIDFSAGRHTGSRFTDITQVRANGKFVR